MRQSAATVSGRARRAVEPQRHRDGWAIDHLAFSLVPQTTVVPVPAAMPLFLAGLGRPFFILAPRHGVAPGAAESQYIVHSLTCEAGREDPASDRHATHETNPRGETA